MTCLSRSILINSSRLITDSPHCRDLGADPLVLGSGYKPFREGNPRRSGDRCAYQPLRGYAGGVLRWRSRYRLDVLDRLERRRHRRTPIQTAAISPSPQ